MKPNTIEDREMARPKNPNKYVSLDVRVPPEIRDAVAVAAGAPCKVRLPILPIQTRRTKLGESETRRMAEEPAGYTHSMSTGEKRAALSAIASRLV